MPGPDAGVVRRGAAPPAVRTFNLKDQQTGESLTITGSDPAQLKQQYQRFQYSGPQRGQSRDILVTSPDGDYEEDRWIFKPRPAPVVVPDAGAPKRARAPRDAGVRDAGVLDAGVRDAGAAVAPPAQRAPLAAPVADAGVRPSGPPRTYWIDTVDARGQRGRIEAQSKEAVDAEYRRRHRPDNELQIYDGDPEALPFMVGAPAASAMQRQRGRQGGSSLSVVPERYEFPRTRDAGVRDAGPADAGARDAARAMDAGAVRDAGDEVDAARRVQRVFDAGAVRDAGPPPARSSDAGPPVAPPSSRAGGGQGPMLGGYFPDKLAAPLPYEATSEQLRPKRHWVEVKRPDGTVRRLEADTMRDILRQFQSEFGEAPKVGQVRGDDQARRLIEASIRPPPAEAPPAAPARPAPPPAPAQGGQVDFWTMLRDPATNRPMWVHGASKETSAAGARAVQAARKRGGPVPHGIRTQDTDPYAAPDAGTASAPPERDAGTAAAAPAAPARGQYEAAFRDPTTGKMMVAHGDTPDQAAAAAQGYKAARAQGRPLPPGVVEQPPSRLERAKEIVTGESESEVQIPPIYVGKARPTTRDVRDPRTGEAYLLHGRDEDEADIRERDFYDTREADAGRPPSLEGITRADGKPAGRTAYFTDPATGDGLRLDGRDLVADTKQYLDWVDAHGGAAPEARGDPYTIKLLQDAQRGEGRAVADAGAPSPVATVKRAAEVVRGDASSSAAELPKGKAPPELPKGKAPPALGGRPDAGAKKPAPLYSEADQSGLAKVAKEARRIVDGGAPEPDAGALADNPFDVMDDEKWNARNRPDAGAPDAGPTNRLPDKKAAESELPAEGKSEFSVDIGSAKDVAPSKPVDPTLSPAEQQDAITEGEEKIAQTKERQGEVLGATAKAGAEVLGQEAERTGKTVATARDIANRTRGDAADLSTRMRELSDRIRDAEKKGPPRRGFDFVLALISAIATLGHPRGAAAAHVLQQMMPRVASEWEKQLKADKNEYERYLQLYGIKSREGASELEQEAMIDALARGRAEAILKQVELTGKSEYERDAGRIAGDMLRNQGRAREEEYARRWEEEAYTRMKPEQLIAMEADGQLSKIGQEVLNRKRSGEQQGRKAEADINRTEAEAAKARAEAAFTPERRKLFDAQVRKAEAEAKKAEAEVARGYKPTETEVKYDTLIRNGYQAYQRLAAFAKKGGALSPDEMTWGSTAPKLSAAGEQRRRDVELLLALSVRGETGASMPPEEIQQRADGYGLNSTREDVRRNALSGLLFGFEGMDRLETLKKIDWNKAPPNAIEERAMKEQEARDNAARKKGQKVVTIYDPDDQWVKIENAFKKRESLAQQKLYEEMKSGGKVGKRRVYTPQNEPRDGFENEGLVEALRRGYSLTRRPDELVQDAQRRAEVKKKAEQLRQRNQELMMRSGEGR